MSDWTMLAVIALGAYVWFVLLMASWLSLSRASPEFRRKDPTAQPASSGLSPPKDTQAAAK
jgi:hypothetical protein